jgi:hypothetical protein
MRYLSAGLCALLLLGCTEPSKTRVIIKRIAVEKPVPVPGPDGARRQCPADEKAWREHCKNIEKPDDCERENYCHWLGGSDHRCVRIPYCKDGGKNYP